MRKIIVSILAVFYLASSTGATVHLHYCMGKLINWSLTNEGEKCAKCGMKKDGGCCKDENKFVKNNFDQKTAESAISLLPLIASSVPVLFVSLTENYSFSLIEKYPICHAPPLITAGEIYIRNCVFRI
jgi:hypothetical protein